MPYGITRARNSLRTFPVRGDTMETLRMLVTSQWMLVCGTAIAGALWVVCAQRTPTPPKEDTETCEAASGHPLSLESCPAQFLYANTQSNLKLRQLLARHSAHDNWVALVQMGDAFRKTMHTTRVHQCLGACASSYASSQLLFPLLWEHMEVWTLLNRMRHFMKNATKYGIRVTTSKCAIKGTMRVSSEVFLGYVLAIVIPSADDFQCVVMTYSTPCKLLHQAVLTRAGVLRASHDIVRWLPTESEHPTTDSPKLPNKIHTKHNRSGLPVNIRMSAKGNVLLVSTEDVTIRFPFTVHADERGHPQLVFSLTLPTCVYHSLS